MKRKYFIILLTTIFLFVSFGFGNVQAASKKTAYVDVKGSLYVRASAKESGKKVGVLKKSSKVIVYRIKNNFAEIRFMNKKAYVSNQFLRYYKTMNNNEAKKIADRSINMQHSLDADIGYYYEQIIKRLSPGFTKEYIRNFIIFDMDKDEYERFHVRATDYPDYYIFGF